MQIVKFLKDFLCQSTEKIAMAKVQLEAGLSSELVSKVNPEIVINSVKNFPKYVIFNYCNWREACYPRKDATFLIFGM